MDAATLVEWRIAPGQSVKRGDVVALVETDKGIIDVETFHDATVEELLVAPGTRVAVGAVLARFSGESSSFATAASSAPSAGPAPMPSPAAEPAAAPTPQSPPTGARLRVSPAARARAAAAGIALEQLTGSGPQGAITLADVEAARRAPAVAAGPASMQSTIARAMVRANRDIPHYYLSMAIDFQPLVDWLQNHNKDRPLEDRLLYVVPILKAVARAAQQVPGFNGFYRDEQFQPAAAVHIGNAVSQRTGGLIAPALLDVADKPLALLMRELSELVGRVRTGHLTSSMLSSATLTVTSLGDEGVDLVLPIIHPDQVAIVGVGTPALRPWVIDGRVVPRTVIQLTLAADHRVSNGRLGARFLGAIRSHLAAPERL